MKQIIIGFLLVLSSSSYGIAQTCTAQANGDWNSAATWDCGIVPDGTITNIVIPSGITVTIPSFNTTINYTGQVSVYGTLRIRYNCSLVMGAGSSVDIFTGGSVTGLDGFFGGASSIVVDGVSIPISWFAPIPGPATIDENGNGPLPITLISFEASTKELNVELSWATASEENFDYFSIERSADGYNFKEIAQVSGAGFSMTRMDYSYTDEFPLQGNSYYRLRSIDFDGYTEIFDYVMVKIDDQIDKFTVYPNPIENGSFKLQTNFILEESMQLIVYNNMGIIQKTFEVTDWLESYSLPSIQPGTYMFKLVGSEEVLVQRVLIK